MPVFSVTSIPDHCDPISDFLARVSDYFHVCIPTPLAFLSSLLGIFSIISWLFAQLPQIYKNYQLQSTAGLSIFFLVEWCLGDTANLVGALLTNQAAWQVVVAGYYVFVDLCLVSQYFWYTYTRPWLDGQSLHSEGSSYYGDDESDIINGLSPINTNFGFDDEQRVQENEGPKQADGAPTKPADNSKLPDHAYEKAASTLRQEASNSADTFSEKSNSSATVSRPLVEVHTRPSPLQSPRTLLYVSTLCALLSSATAFPAPSSTSSLSSAHVVHTNSLVEIAGTVTSWLSAVLYLGSRIPQLVKNFRRKSTTGLSPLLFAAAFCGNLFYSTSLLTNPNAWNSFGPYGGHGWAGPRGSDRGAWVSAAIPFFLGAAGVLAMDGIMGIQFVVYGEMDQEKIVKVRDSEGGPGRWELVSGWMRGWIPAVRAERQVSIAEGSALLTRSREMSRSHVSEEYGTF